MKYPQGFRRWIYKSYLNYMQYMGENPMQSSVIAHSSQKAKFMGPAWSPPGSCRSQMGPILAPWTLLSGVYSFFTSLPTLINALPLGRYRSVILKPTLLIDILNIFKETPRKGLLQDTINDWSTLVKVMAWCRQVITHYLIQCWPNSMSSTIGH